MFTDGVLYGTFRLVVKVLIVRVELVIAPYSKIRLIQQVV